ncbi:hypothetical protein FBQ82_07550 [Anaerolineae bacterium CFX7]|nr:hypothetical protein [Anaerolineae bacterium CFX7]
MSTARLFTAILFIALFALTIREISDPDFWWHLRAGQYMLENATIPHTDPFAFTAQAKEWITHEWLSEIFMFGVYRLGGFALLTLLFSGIITLAFALTYARSDGKPYLAGFALLLGALATAPTWGVRPQMLTLLFLSAFLFLLDRFSVTRENKFLIPLPLLMLVWVNLHSGYAMGLVALGAYWFAAFVEGIVFLARKQRAQNSLDAAPTLSPRNTRALLIVLILSALAVLVNPNGARMFIYPFETLTSAAMQRYIQEWFSPDFHQTEWLPFALLLVSLLATTLIARARVPLAHILLLFALGLLALRSARNIPLFVLVALPVLSAQLAAWLSLRASNKPTPRPMQIINAVIVVVLALAVLARAGSVLANQANVERAKFPAAAVAWIQQNRPAPNLYNSYGWGGYLIWKLYPQYQVYIDGRADVHGDAFIEDFLDIYRAAAGWENKLAEKNVRLVLIEPDAPLATALANDSAWTRVFSDSQSVVYQKE